MNQRSVDILLCIILWGVCGVFFYQISKLSYPSTVFPLVITSCILLCTILIFVPILFNRTDVKKGALRRAKNYRKVIVLSLSSIIAIFSIQWIGFYTINFVYLILFATYLQPSHIKLAKKVYSSTLFAVIMTGAVYITFNWLLNVQTPKGLFI